MKITKFGHCCFLVEEKGTRILFDPGHYSAVPAGTPADVILITHDHGDHLDPALLARLRAENPAADVVTNRNVAALLAKQGIPAQLLLAGERREVRGVAIEAYGEKHATMLPSLPQSENTGYLIARRFFFPGDALTDPGRPVEILACPLAGPWLTLAEGVAYALRLAPKVCIPAHEGILKQAGSAYRLPGPALARKGISFIVPEEGKPVEFP